MGTVYKVLNTKLDRIEALKIVNEDLSQSEKYREKLEDEAKKAAMIDSPYVVKVWDYGELENRSHISLEFVEGQILRKIYPEIDLEKKIELAIKIAKGISAAHKKDVVHRDLKPENIKISPEGDPKILDFGLALSASRGDSVDASGNIEGTVAYASPEQLSGEATSSRSDLFSFGIILYEMFTGELPFKGDYSASTIYSILYDEPDSPSEIDENFPEWLNEIIMKLLQKNPSDRFADADEVTKYFEEYAYGPGPVKGRISVSKRRKTVTVLDLKNLSGDESIGYQCEGFSEEVIKELNYRTDLIVSPQPESSMPKDIREVFKRCRTDFVITGSLMSWQQQIRLSLTIYSEHGDQVIFSKKYEGSSDDLLKLLDEAATGTAGTLSDVTGSETRDTVETRSKDVSAFDFYLKGRSYYDKGEPEYLSMAVDMYKKALNVDPNYALAHSGLADVYAFQYMAFYDHTPARIAEAKTEAEQALEINPKLAEAHRALGRYYQFSGNLPEAEKQLTKAIHIDPKYAIGYRTLAWVKLFAGDLDEAQKWAKKARELAPTDLETHLLLGLIQMDQRQYTVALATLLGATELAPDYGRGHYNLGNVYMKLGLPDMALEYFLKAIKHGGEPNSFIDAGYVYLLQGDYDVAKEMFKQSIAEGHLKFAAHYYLALAERLSSHEQEAVEQFQKVLSEVDTDDATEMQNNHLLVFRAQAFGSIGRTEEATKILTSLAAKKDISGEVLSFMARGYSLVGDNDNCRKYLHMALEKHDGPTEKEAKLDPHFANILD